MKRIKGRDQRQQRPLRCELLSDAEMLEHMNPKQRHRFLQRRKDKALFALAQHFTFGAPDCKVASRKAHAERRPRDANGRFFTPGNETRPPQDNRLDRGDMSAGPSLSVERNEPYTSLHSQQPEDVMNALQRDIVLPSPEEVYLHCLQHPGACSAHWSNAIQDNSMLRSAEEIYMHCEQQPEKNFAGWDEALQGQSVLTSSNEVQPDEVTSNWVDALQPSPNDECIQKGQPDKGSVNWAEVLQGESVWPSSEEVNMQNRQQPSNRADALQGEWPWPSSKDISEQNQKHPDQISLNWVDAL